jgi:hypothetical protein
MPAEGARQRKSVDVDSNGHTNGSNGHGNGAATTVEKGKESWRFDHGHREFGGAKGALGIMIFSHFLMLYFWYNYLLTIR